MTIFQEVSNHYTETDSGNIAIDAYVGRGEDEDGVTVAWVTPDGEVTAGVYSKPEHLNCELVQQAIKEALNSQEQRKMTMVNVVVNDFLDHPDKLPNLMMMIPYRKLEILCSTES